MDQEDLSVHIARTYVTLRRVLGFVGFILPPLLWFGYYFFTRDLHLQDSMSAYYHAGGGVMRGWFVGSLFAIAALLVAYHGFTWLEDWALNLAGGLAIGVAVFPMAWPRGSNNDLLSLHGACAVLFFACIAYVCAFQASATLTLISDLATRARYRRVYRLLGILMIVLPAAAAFLTSMTSLRNSVVYFVEAAGVWVFAFYWIIKTREVGETGADFKAARGILRRPKARAADVFRILSVTPLD